MEKNERKIGICMNVLMGFFLSLGLSLVGTLSGGHFVPVQWLLSFAASFALSLIIGFCIPVRRLSQSLCSALHLAPRTLPAHALDCLVSDVLYTPLITLLMVFLAFRIARSHGAPVQFLPMFLKSLAVCMVAGYVLIFVLQPLFLRLLGAGGKGKPSGGGTSDSE